MPEMFGSFPSKKIKTFDLCKYDVLMEIFYLFFVIAEKINHNMNIIFV